LILSNLKYLSNTLSGFLWCHYSISITHLIE